MQTKGSANTVKVLDKEFEKFIDSGQIQARIKEIAGQMKQEMAGLNPVFLAVLNGSFFFAADLLKEIDFPFEISFVKVSSYRGTSSAGTVTTLLGLDENLRGRSVVVLEDIVDTGRTMVELIRQLNAMQINNLKIATLILKPASLLQPVPLDYVGFEVPDEFLIGYGLDYDKQGRHFKDIYKVKS